MLEAPPLCGHRRSLARMGGEIIFEHAFEFRELGLDRFPVFRLGALGSEQAQLLANVRRTFDARFGEERGQHSLDFAEDRFDARFPSGRCLHENAQVVE